MSNLKGSKTEANLLTAFAGESQARNKYTYYASAARKEGLNQIADQPRIAQHAPADHHRVNPRFLNSRHRFFHTADIAVAYDWNRNRFLDLLDPAPIGLTLIQLSARPAMHG